MIEVEMHFQPSENRLRKLLLGAEFIREIENHDVYYDFPDYRLAKVGIKLRKRNGSFELKIEKSKDIEEEIENEDEIKKYFQTDLAIEKFTENNMVILTDFKTKRTKYKKCGFTIDVDECDFGYNVCEIELMVKEENKAQEGKEKIIKFAQDNGLEFKKIMGKRKTYLIKNNLELFKKIWGDHKL